MARKKLYTYETLVLADGVEPDTMKKYGFAVEGEHIGDRFLRTYKRDPERFRDDGNTWFSDRLAFWQAPVEVDYATDDYTSGGPFEIIWTPYATEGKRSAEFYQDLEALFRMIKDGVVVKGTAVGKSPTYDGAMDYREVDQTTIDSIIKSSGLR